MENRKKELADRTDKTLHVMYDLRYLPVTFDCATYFVGANATRQVMGLSRMHVHVIAPSFVLFCKNINKVNVENRAIQLKGSIDQLTMIIDQMDRDGQGGLMDMSVPKPTRDGFQSNLDKLAKCKKQMTEI